MKRLFYLATNLDDVANIVYAMEAEGITDKQFFVLSRDEYALRRRFLHGDKTLEDTRIIAAAQRSNVFSISAVVIFIVVAFFVVSIDEFLSMPMFVFCLMIFVFVKYAVLVGGGMYDDYFKGVFNNKLDQGETIVVVDVNQKQDQFISNLFKQCPTTDLLVDASNFLSPLPLKKYIKRNCLVKISPKSRTDETTQNNQQ